MTVFEALVEDAPSDPWAACALAANQLAVGQVLEALRTLESHRADPAARLLRAETLAIAGNLREAANEAGLLQSLVGGPGWARLQLRLRAALPHNL